MHILAIVVVALVIALAVSRGPGKRRQVQARWEIAIPERRRKAPAMSFFFEAAWNFRRSGLLVRRP